MKTYLISYDLGSPETREEYKKIFDRIKLFSQWAKPLQSVWFIKSDKSAGEILAELKTTTSSNDKILVIEVRRHWGTFGISSKVTDWMKSNME